jgi:hypothetical protein
MPRAHGFSRVICRLAVATAVTAVVACGRELPSAKPLGLGPLADEIIGIPDERVTTSPGGAPLREVGSEEAPPAPPPTEKPVVDRSGDAPKPTPDSKLEAKADDKPRASEPDAAADFAGEWNGEDTVVYRLQQLPDRTAVDPKARITIVKDGERTIAMTLIDTSDGDAICTVRATVAGRTAALRAGQPCFDSGPLSGKITSGTVTLNGGELIVELKANVELTLEGEKLGGVLEYRFVGRRGS